MLHTGFFLRRIKSIFLLTALITTSVFAQTTYYISDSEGNDSNNGLSESSPWKTLEKLHDSWNIIGPGDQILFKSGDIWAPTYSNLDRIGVIRIPNLKKGSSGNPIVLGSYGSGAKPILSNQNVSGYHQLLRSGAMEYFEFRNLRIQGQILLRANESLATGLNHIAFYNCDIENYSPILYSGFSGPQSLFPLSNVDNWAKVRNITFKYCKFTNCTGNGGTLNFGPYENCYIGYCEFYNGQEEAIDLAGGTGNIIEYNIISGTSVNGIKLHSQYSLFDGGIIRGNLIIYSGNGTTGGAGLGLQNVQNCQVYNNTVYAPMYAAMFGNRDRLAPEGYFGNFEGNEIRNNIFYGMVAVMGTWENVTISGVPMPYKNQDTHLFLDNTFSNNTFWTAHPSNYIFRFWKNDGYPNQQYNDYVYKDVYKNNQSSFDTHWGNKTDASEKMRDPNFTNPNWINAQNFGSYDLDAISNEVNSGYLIPGYNQDLAGNNVPQGGAQDRGAFEFNENDFIPPTVVSANIVDAATVEINFSERLTPVTAENSANYSITGGISVSNAALSTSGMKVTLFTSPHTTDTYTITVSNIEDYSGNVMSSNNTAQYSFIDDTLPPEVVSVDISNSTTVIVNFSEELDQASAEDTDNYSINNGVSVSNAELSISETQVTLTTSQHPTGNFTLTVSNVKDKSNNAITSNNTGQYSFNSDNTPPEVLSVNISNASTIEALFSEPLEQLSAENISNYSINNGVSVSNALLAPNGTRVTLTTSEHATGDYLLTVIDVEDTSGNVISDSNTGGYSFINDSGNPSVLSAELLNDTTVLITFNETLNPDTAVNANNYSISNGIIVYSVSIDSSGTKTTLFTSPHTIGNYTVTVSNVLVLAGNVITNNNTAQYSFVFDSTPPEVQSATIINFTTIKIYFSETLHPLLATNAENYTINNGISVNNAVLDSGSIVTLSTTPHSTGNYLVTVINVTDTANNVISSNNTASYLFNADTTPPELLAAEILGISSVKTIFSEELDESSAQNLNNYSIDNGIEIQNAALSVDGKSVLLTTSDHTTGDYTVTVSGVKDFEGNIIGTNNSAQYNFNTDVQPPQVSNALIINANTIKITFSESLYQLTATEISNYLIDNNIDVLGAEILSPGNEVILSTTDHAPGLYNVTVSNVADLSGNVISNNNNATYSYDPDLVLPNLIFAITTDRNTIEIAYSEDVTQESAENIQNYTITNNIQVLSATRSESGDKVTLITEDLITGETYTLFINNIEDLSGNKIIAGTSTSLYCFANNLSPIALYDFTLGIDSNIVYDVSCKGTPLNLTISNPSAVNWINGGGLSVNSSTTISSEFAATKIIDRCKNRNSITLEVWIKPDNLTQNGPARIVTLSNGISARNFTFGQGTTVSNEGYDVRLRSTATDNNGIPSLTSTAQSLTTELTQVVYTRESNGDTKIYINGVENVSSNIEGDLSNWNGLYKLAIANELSGDRPWKGELHKVAIYDYTLTLEQINECFENFNTTIYVNTRLFLEGPYQSGTMSTLLNTMDIIPLQQPYYSEPWNYHGSELVTELPPDIVDWILVELRSKKNTIVSEKAAFLRKDGMLVDLNGISKVFFTDIAEGSYYIVIHHRNHLSIMSSGKVLISSSTPIYDLTISNNIMGSGGGIDLGGAIFGLYAGDVNSSMIITNADVKRIMKNNTTAGYDCADVNLSGIITYADITSVVDNNTKNSKVPRKK